MDTTHYYNETIKKYIKIFGAIFSNWKIKHGESEIRVPIVYGGKSKIYIDRTQTKRTTERPGEILLPVMSYQITSIVHDIEKQTQPVKIYDNSAESEIDFIKVPKPFNIDFDLFLWTKYENDMYQLLEQFLYEFSPKKIFSVNIFPGMSFRWDILLLLNDNADETENKEYGEDNTLKEMKWRLSFTIKGYLFSNIFQEKLIKIVTANYKGYDDENEIDPNKILQVEEYKVNPFSSQEEDDYTVKLTKTIGDKTYITFIEK